MKAKPQRRELLAWAGLAALGGSAQAEEVASPPPLERATPDMPLGQTFDGKALRLADLAGKPVIVFFWASWCPYCRQELPVLERIQAKTKDSLPIVAINVEERAVFRQLVRALSGKTQLTHTYDPDEASAKAFRKPGSLPYTMVLRANGTVAARQSGWSVDSIPVIVKHVNDVLADARAAAASAPSS